MNIVNNPAKYESVVFEVRQLSKCSLFLLQYKYWFLNFKLEKVGGGYRIMYVYYMYIHIFIYAYISNASEFLQFR